MPNPHKTLILGSGPAGYTAAIYAARAMLQPVVLAGNQPGGQLTITTDVENYPGYPDGVLGPDMMEMFKKQAERFGTEVLFEHGEKVDLSERPFKVWTTADKEYHCETLIISTGASASYLGLPNETALQGRGVSACATCDGFFFKQKTVHVVGGGDSACEEATFLTRYADKVFMVVRRDELRASKIMQERARENPKIEILWEQNVTDVLDVEAGKVTELELTHSRSGEKQRVRSDGLFLAIGHKPNTDLFRGMIDMDDKGYLITQPDKAATNADKLFVFHRDVTAAREKLAKGYTAAR